MLATVAGANCSLGRESMEVTERTLSERRAPPMKDIALVS